MHEVILISEISSNFVFPSFNDSYQTKFHFKKLPSFQLLYKYVIFVLVLDAFGGALDRWVPQITIIFSCSDFRTPRRIDTHFSIPTPTSDPGQIPAAPTPASTESEGSRVIY